MKKRKKNYLITWYIQLSNGYVDIRQIKLISKHSATIMYNKIAKDKKTLSIELEEV